mgnify:CR=1 FL=1
MIPARTNLGKTIKPFARLSGYLQLKRTDIKYRNPYQTRHTFASMLLSRGENPMFVAQQMGHKDWSMIIKVYGRWIL